ncbi:hypothetical protein NAI64_05790 [Oxalobacter sp. OxGP1]|uniref:LPD3 domain-containing protein n=1 Tax=Oxalobacter paeniformigenes TaxID=2946594 RepID=UPI0022AEABB4|nr:hypothetical protein [Oxalobacter paeniformigenes]MCZ4053237.1 hypothetical protein [Oxalobacter paeniformigenes]
MRVDAIGTVRTFEDTGIDPAPVDAGAAWDATGHGEIPEPSTESLSERANRSVEQMRKEFAEIQKQNDEWRNNVLRMNVAQADNAVPDDEARVNELAKQFNAPADMVRNYRKLFEAQARNLKLEELQKTNPKTAEFLTDPNNARIAHDDIDNLARTEDAIDSVLAYPQAFAAGIVRDFLGNRIKGATERILSSNYTTRMMQDVYAGAIGLSDDRLASQWDDIDAVEYKTMRDIIMTPAQAVIAAGNRIDVPDKQKPFGVQVAAGLGQVAGQIASAFIDPAGQLSALIDQGIGAVSDDVQKDIEAAREAGVDVDFSSRLAAIIGGGVATGVTEKLSLELIGSPLASRIANRAARFATRTLVGGLSEGFQEVAESALQTYIRQQFTNPGAKYQTGAEMFDEFTVSGAVGAIVANMLGLRRFRIGRATEKGIKSLNDEAKASKLRGRDKQVYETLVSTQTEGTPLENAYINTEAWRTYFQSQGLDPKEQAERYGVTNYDEAVATGSDLSIPFPAYQADFSASDHAPNFVRDTKLSENGMTVNEQEAYMQRLEERAKETESLLERIGKESENARAVNDVLSRLTDDIAVQLEPTFDKQTARTQATIMARAFLNPVQRDVIERAREQGEELTADEIAGRIRDAFDRYGLTINPSATPTTLNTRKDVDPAIDSMLEKLRKNEIPKERDVYGQSLLEYIRKKGGIRPNDVIRDMVKNKELPRSILNEKGMGADELAALQDVLDFGIETESMQADNALLDALVNEYTTGEKRYSNAQLNAGLLAELQALDNLSRDIAAAGIDLNADNATIRDALSKYYEEQNGKNTGKESQTAETERYEQRGFTESDIPTAEERAEANRQYDEIEKKYRRTPLWMKAPNGKPTKLTERQWVQVRTPNFKRWFGDWEKAGIRERLGNQDPVAVEAKYNTASPKERRDIALGFFPENVTVTKPVGNVVISRRSIRSSFSHGSTDVKLDVMPYLTEILEKSEYIDTLQDFDGGNIQNHYFATKITHGGQNKLVFMRARKMPGRENQLYVHDVFVEEDIKQKDQSDVSKSGYSRNTVDQLRGSDLYKSILQDIYAVDKDAVSKVVDKNGEPLVVYHGTTADFDTFKPSESRKTEGTGMWFGSSNIAGTYTGRDKSTGSVMPVFLNAKNPVIVNAKRSFWSEIGGDISIREYGKKRGTTLAKIFGFRRTQYGDWSDYATTDDIARYAYEHGYDGVIFDNIRDIGPTEELTSDESYTPSSIYSVSTPKQIKSAIGNIGTFSESQNILYQREPVVRLTGDELGNSADIFDAARNWYKQNLQGTSVNRSEIGDIRFSGKGWNKVKRGIKGDSLKAKIIPAIRDVIAHGKYHGRTGLNKSRTDDIVAFHYFTADVSIGDDIIPVGVNVGEDVYGNLFYNINHHPDDLLKKKAPILPREEARGLEPDNPRNHQSSSHGPRVRDTESDVLEQSIKQNEDGVNLFILNKKNQGKVRGATIINPDRTMRIELFKDANYSTFVHETAHFMLEVYGDLASDPQSSEYIRNEYATIRKYLGTKDGEAITREQHEKFARSFEAYLMEGKAPSPELQGIFSRFKNWLLNIYRSMRGLRVNLNKDIREVFDRMLASDEEISVMRDASELQPLFATAEKMGIAQDEFDAYMKIAEKELIDAQDRFRQKAMKAKLREKRKGYKEELEAEKNRVEKEYDRDPVVAAFNDLTSDNGISLNEAELRRIYGKAFLAKLPRKNGKRIYSKDGNVSLEELAEGLGFNSGDELIRAIAQLPNRKKYIEDKARQNIIDREGDVLNSDNIADEAENALHNEYMEQRLKKELAILMVKTTKLSEQRKRIEQRKEAKRIEEDVNAQVDAMEVAARSVIAEKPVKELKPNLYLRAMQKASRQARQELDRTDPDYTAAARQKQAEIMNNILYREATRVQKELNRRTLQAKAVVRKSLKDAVKTRDSLFVNRAKYIAAKLGLGGNADLIMQRIVTEEKNRQDVEPFRYDLAVPLRELNTATALDVLEDVKANWDQARRGKVMLIDGKRVEIDEAAKAISDKLADFGKTWRSSSRDDSLRNKLLKQIGSMVLDQTRMEAWCDMVDGARLGEETGPWMKYVFNPVKQAADKTRLSQAEYTKRLTEIIDSFRFTRETIEAPELGYTFGKDTGYGKAELIHALLHTGNMSNFQRLLVGRGWGSVLNGQVNAARWNAFMSRMIAEGRITEKDMDGVQKIWDVFEELKPQSQRAYKEVFGRYFDEITATPFTMFGKRYAGGYVPVIYDSRESGAGEKQLNPTMDLLNQMGTAFPRLQAGWGNSRKEGNFGPLLLDLSRLRDHISRQILFANMAPVNKDVSRLLNRKNVSDTIRGYDPEFMGTVIKPWLSRAITQNLETSGKKPAPYDKVARELRTRAGAITMFGNVVNAIEQVFDMTAAYSKVKGRYLTDAFRTMVSDRAGTVKAVMDASDYMRGRRSAEIMAANGRLEQALRPGRLKKLDRWLIDHAYFLQASVDNFCGPLTWMAAYNQATESGLSHRDAVSQADSVVRQVFGANAAEDVANFEAGGSLKRLFSQFTGYFIQRANLISGEYSKIQRSDIANRKASVAILLLQTALLPAWIGAAIRKFAAGGDDDETYASWLLDVFGWGTVNYGLSMGGLAGQISNAALDWYRGKSFSSGRVFYPPAIKMIEDAFKFRKWEDSSGDFDVSKFIQDMAEIERVVPGLPIIPARPVATARYIYDVATDEVQPTGGYDFVRGVVTGRASADSRQ